MTSCAGHVDGMKKRTVNNSSITRQNQPKLFRYKVHGFATAAAKHFVVKVTHLVPGPF